MYRFISQKYIRIFVCFVFYPNIFGYLLKSKSIRLRMSHSSMHTLFNHHHSLLSLFTKIPDMGLSIPAIPIRNESHHSKYLQTQKISWVTSLQSYLSMDVLWCLIVCCIMCGVDNFQKNAACWNKKRGFSSILIPFKSSNSVIILPLLLN